MSDSRLMPSGDLAEQRSPGLRLAPPYDFLGRLTLPFSIILTGGPGSGKSTWALPFARTLADLGPTIYATPEEGHSDTFGDKLRRLGAAHPQLYVADVYTPTGILELVDETGARFVILDSATHLDASSRAVVDLWRELKRRGVSLVALAHVRTDGGMKGGTFIGHDLGAIVRVENVDGEAVARTEKNRYGQLAAAPVAFDSEQLAKLSGGRPFGFEVLDPADVVLADSVESYHRNPGAAETLFASTEPVGAASRRAFAQAARDGTLAQGRIRYEVRGFFVDRKGRPVVALRSPEGDDALAFAGRRGLIWRKGITAAALKAFTEIDPDTVAADQWHLNGGHWSTDDEIRRAMFAAMKERGTYDPSRTSKSTRARSASSGSGSSGSASSSSSSSKPAAKSTAKKSTAKKPATKKQSAQAAPAAAQAPAAARTSRKASRTAPAQERPLQGATTADVPADVLDAADDSLARIEKMLADALK